MARWPAPGRCKSRLARSLGIERAAVIQDRLGHHAVRTALQTRRMLSSSAEEASSGSRLDVVVASSGLGPRASRRWVESLGISRVVPQGEGSLGLRLQRQVIRALGEGAPAVVLIGSDLPQLSAGDLIEALDQLHHVPLVLGPARDGGYWLIGLRQSRPQLFAGIDWGSDRVLKQTLTVARRFHLATVLLTERADLDRPEDLQPWR